MARVIRLESGTDTARAARARRCDDGQHSASRATGQLVEGTFTQLEERP